MKKVTKLILFTILTIMPLGLIAKETEKEVQYKYYVEVKENEHYEETDKYCEVGSIIDKEDKIYTDYKYSFSQTEIKDNRIIEKEQVTLNLNKDFVDTIYINNFETNYKVLKITEIEFYDENNNLLDYKVSDYVFRSGSYRNILDSNLSTYVEVDNASRLEVKFEKAIELLNTKIKIKYINEDNKLYGIFYYGIMFKEPTNAFDHTSTSNNIVCDENICESLIEINDFMRDLTPKEVNTIIYKYKDILYKCYDLKRIYLPGYYKELEGFIKDEEKYKEVEVITVEENEEEALSILDNIENKYNEMINNKQLDNMNYLNTLDLLQTNYDNLYTLISDKQLQETKMDNTLEKEENKTLKCDLNKEVEEKMTKENLILLIICIMCLVTSTVYYIKNVKDSRTK